MNKQDRLIEERERVLLSNIEHKIAEEFNKLCLGRSCPECKYYTTDRYLTGRTGCFVEYLAEEVTE